MKKLLFLAIITCATGCAYNRVGSLTMISTRNIDYSTEYVELARGVEGTSKMKRDDAMQEAIDEAVNSVPGGEYMMNTVVYVKDNRIIKVKGDVWGRRAGSEPAKIEKVVTFSPGQKVKYIDSKKRKVNATVVAVNNGEITIELDHNQVQYIVTEHDLIKL